MISITEAAQEQIRATLEESGESVIGLRVIALAPRQYRMDLVEEGESHPEDIEQKFEGFSAYLDPHTAEVLDGATVEYVENESGAGFRIDNPKDTPERPTEGADAEVWDRVQALLDSTINPSVAMHGGMITLIGVQDGVVSVEMGGGCQGCGMANVTLRHGVEAMLREEIPEVVEVRDVTDHAGGRNPYYAASTK